jgi:hypothetical protein
MYGEGSEGHMFGKDSGKKQCVSLERKLVEYLDGRAKPADRHAVEQHLSVCASCRLRADEFRAVSSVLDDLPAISPSPAFDASLRARIAAEPARRSFWSWPAAAGWLPSPRLAFAVTSLIAISVWMSSGGRVVPGPAVSGQTIEPDKISVESEFGMIRDLPVLENYDVVSKFDALSELPGPATSPEQEGTKEAR